VAGQGIEYVEATLEDIALANELAPEVLGRSLDELPPQTRRLLGHIRALVRSRGAAPAPADAGASGSVASLSPRHECTFSRRELREACGWSLTQVRVHLNRLVELEYLELRHGRLGSSFVYELMVDAEAPQHVAHIGLIDVGELRKKYGYGREVADFKPRVAVQSPAVAAGGETSQPPSKPRSSEGETAA